MSHRCPVKSVRKSFRGRSLGSDWARNFSRTVLPLAAALCAMATAEAQVPFRTVTLNGDVAPGTPGAQFDRFFASGSTILINNAGQVAFFATLVQGTGDVTTPNSDGIWAEQGGTLKLVARTGDQAPGAAPGAMFNAFGFAPVLNDAGQVSFVAGLRLGVAGVTTANDNGIWSGAPGSVVLRAREGSVAPGTGGALFSGGFSDPVSLNQTGQIALRGGAGLFFGLWSDTLGSTTSIAQSGAPAPGTTGVYNNVGNFSVPLLNNQGEAAFAAGLKQGTGGVDATNDSGIWSAQAGVVTLEARKGSQVPGAPAGILFGSTNLGGINDAGQLLVSGVLQTGSGGIDSSNNSAVWKGNAGGYSLVLQKGDQAPGTLAGTLFDSAGGVINNAGQVALMGLLQPGTGDANTFNNHGIWLQSGGALNLIARQGSQAPGLPAGSNFDSISNPLLNGLGQVVFSSNLSIGAGGVTPSNNNVLYATDPFGQPVPVFREGDPVEVAPGDVRILAAASTSSVTLSTSGGADGRPRSLNDAGQLALLASFTDTSSAILVADVSNVVVDHDPAVPSTLQLDDGLGHTAPGTLTVGRGRQGALEIGNGTHAQASTAFIARDTGSVGTLTVAGANSDFTTIGSLYVGGNANRAGGTGLLQLDNSGTVHVGDTLKIWSPGSVEVHSGVLSAATVVNDGTIDGGAGATLDGAVSGIGRYLGKVVFTGSFSPGASPALISGQSMAFGASDDLIMEIGGRARGSEYDAIDAIEFDLGGELSLRLIDLGPGRFKPAAGDFFDLLIGRAFNGDFASFDLPLLDGGLLWTRGLADLGGGMEAYRLVVASAGPGAAPAPGTVWLVALALWWIARLAAPTRWRRGSLPPRA